MWQTTAWGMKMRVKWFYHKEEVEGSCKGGGEEDIKTEQALFSSNHYDENNVQTISHKCEVVQPEEYKERQKMGANKNIYWLAGDYDPFKKRITFGLGVST